MGDQDHVTAEQVEARLAEAIAPFARNQRDSLEGDNDAYNVYDDVNTPYGQEGDFTKEKHDEL